MQLERLLAAIGDSLLYLADRLSELRDEPQRGATGTTLQVASAPQQVAEPVEPPPPTNEQRLLERIRAAGMRGLTASNLTRDSRSMSAYQRGRAIQKLLDMGFIQQETIKTDGRPKTVLIANPGSPSLPFIL